MQKDNAVPKRYFELAESYMCYYTEWVKIDRTRQLLSSLIWLLADILRY